MHRPLPSDQRFSPSRRARASLRVVTACLGVAGAACSGASLPPDAGEGAPADGGVPTDAAIEPPTTSPAAGSVVINEVTSSGGDFIELKNLSSESVDLSSWWVADSGYDPRDPLTADHQFWFPSGTTIEAGAYRLLEKDVDHLFGLSSDGDAVRLFDAEGRLVDEVSWGIGEAATSYCRQPDGTGDFRVCSVASFGDANPPQDELPPIDGGTLDGGAGGDGAADGGLAEGDAGAGDLVDAGPYTPPASLLVLNEVRSSGDDEVELYNRGTTPIDLTGYAFYDLGYVAGDASTAGQRYEIPAGTTIDAGGFLVFVKGTHHSFGLGGADGVTLMDPSGQVLDSVSYPDGAAATSYCRQPDGEGPFQSCTAATLGVANAAR